METPDKVFYDSDIQSVFDRQGYVVIDLLSADEVSKLLTLYDEIEGVKGTVISERNTYELSFFEKDVETKKRKFAVMKQFFSPLLDKYLAGYSAVIINLFNKEFGTGEVPIHQNWTFVDERHHTSVSVWCPLQDVSRENGTLEVVPGSQKVMADYRGPSIPWVFDNLNEVMKKKHMVPLELHTGQVAIIDDSVIHYSGINHTHNDRRAVQLIMKPQIAQLIHCYQDPANKDEIEILAIDDDFFFDFDMSQKPKSGRLIDKVNFPIHKLTETELLERCNQNLTS